MPSQHLINHKEEISLNFLNIVDQQRNALKVEKRQSRVDAISIASREYGTSVIDRIIEAVDEAEGSCDFAAKILYILSTTVIVTILLGIFIVIPVAMITIGVKYLHECPVEPKLPVYLMVGGSFGLLKTLSLLWKQIRSRRYERIDDAYDPTDVTDDMLVSKSSQFSDCLLTLFLLCWFGCGNYWVFHVWPPHYHQLLHDPSNWCDKTVYIFVFAQVIGTYSLIGFFSTLALILTLFHKLFLDSS